MERLLGEMGWAALWERPGEIRGRPEKAAEIMKKALAKERPVEGRRFERP
jgi:hypothetical protein